MKNKNRSEKKRRTPKKRGEKKITQEGERERADARVEIIQARKEISSVIGQMITARRKKRSIPGVGCYF